MKHSLFPTRIYQEKLQQKSLVALNNHLKKEILQFRRIDGSGQKWSLKNYPGGYTSYGSISELHKISSTFENLEKLIRKHVISFSKSLEMDIRSSDLKISSLWMNVMPQNVSHTMHLHPLSVVSGTYYVQTPPGSSALKFEDPRLAQFMASPPRKQNAKPMNQRFISVLPNAGELVLFESWTKHEVPPNGSKQDRISISFNYDWK